MSGGWASLVWLVGALVLAVSAIGAQRVNARKLVVYGAAWAAVFAAVAFVIGETGH